MNIPWRFLPPNMATFASVVLAVAAIRTADQGNLDGAAWLVLLCMLFDKLDGSLARMLHAQSRFGVEMDSFADFIAFGLAPGFLIMSSSPDFLSLPFVLACFYMAGCLGRLVRFNVEDATALPDQFRGLPSTISGGLVALLVLVGRKHGMSSEQLTVALNVAAVGLGLAMVSGFPLPKMGRSGNKLLDFLMVAGVLTSAVTIVLRVWPEFVLAQALLFLAVGPFMVKRAKTAH